MTKTCLQCGESFEPLRRHRVFCSDKCKARAWREKQRSKTIRAGPNEDDDGEDADEKIDQEFYADPLLKNSNNPEG